MPKRSYTRKYSKEVMEPAVKSSTSVFQVMDKVGAPKSSGGAHAWIKALIKEYGLDTTHFLGQAHLRGTTSNKRKPPSEVLVKRAGSRRESAFRLRRALVESGTVYTCAECKQGETWNGKPLTLQVDHIDGDPSNNCKDNLRFLCPNCHSQTSNWGTKKLAG